MTSDNVKAIGYSLLLVGLAVGAYQIYRRAAAASQAVSGLVDGASTSISNAASQVAAAPAAAVQSVVDKVSSFFNGSAAETGDSRFVDLVNFSQWPASVKQAIDLIKRHRNEKTSSNSNDYLGWKVYRDGTFTSPSGEYYIDQNMRTVWDGRSLEGMSSMNFTPVGRATSSGFVSNAQSDFWDFKPVYVDYTGWPSVSDIPY